MRRIDYDGIGSGFHQSVHTLERVGGNAHTGCHAQAAFLVLAGHGFVLGLSNIFISNQSHEAAVLVGHGELLDFIFLQNLRGGHEVGLLRGGHEVVLRHHLVDEFVEVAFEAEVAVGHDAHEAALVGHYGNTANVVFAHQRQRVAHGAAAANGHGVVDHAVFGTLHNSHLPCLFLDAHILVYHADTAFAGNGDGHFALGHGVHCGSDKRDLQLDVARELGFEGNGTGQNFRVRGYKQDVVIGKAVHDNFVGNKIRYHKCAKVLLRTKLLIFLVFSYMKKHFFAQSPFIGPPCARRFAQIKLSKHFLAFCRSAEKAYLCCVSKEERRGPLFLLFMP